MRVSVAALAAALAELCLVGSAASMTDWPQDSSNVTRQSNPMPAEEEEYGDEFLVPNAVEGFFEQLVDHKNPSAGTFTQRYWFNIDYYKGDGYPIVLIAPDMGVGEDGLFSVSNYTISGQYAQAIGCAAVLLEHRYAGGSSPVDELTDEALAHMTIENSVEDIVYFANNVNLTFDPTKSSRPSKAPWILTGCGWGGSLTAWTSHMSPNTFWAYHASSAAVQALRDFWQFYDPIEKALPRNCSADYKRVVAHVDETLRSGSAEQRQVLKDLFGFGALEHDDDFASSINKGLNAWSHHNPNDLSSPLTTMCDYIENQWDGSNVEVPGIEGVGKEMAIQGFAKWSREVSIPSSCSATGYWPESDNMTVACWDSYDKLSPIYQDTSVNNRVNRIYYWMKCDGPFESWAAWGPGASESGLIPEKDASEIWRRQCDYYFPNGTYGLKQGRTIHDFNAITGGWEVANSTRFIWSNGEHDPMLGASVSSPWRPGGPLESTKDAPVWVIPKASSCADQFVGYGGSNPEIKEIMDAEIAQIKAWVDDYYEQIGGWPDATVA